MPSSSNKANPKFMFWITRPRALSWGVSVPSMSPSPLLSRKYGPIPTKAFTPSPPIVKTSTTWVVPSVRVAVSFVPKRSVKVPMASTKSAMLKNPLVVTVAAMTEASSSRLRYSPMASLTVSPPPVGRVKSNSLTTNWIRSACSTISK